jgi:hypothetical protein
VIYLVQQYPTCEPNGCKGIVSVSRIWLGINLRLLSRLLKFDTDMEYTRLITIIYFQRCYTRRRATKSKQQAITG